MILYHGTSDIFDLSEGAYVLPPDKTGTLPHYEATREERDKIYATSVVSYAKIYAGRACQAVGGNPVVWEVWIPDELVEIRSDRKGATVYAAPCAKVISRVK